MPAAAARYLTRHCVTKERGGGGGLGRFERKGAKVEQRELLVWLSTLAEIKLTGGRIPQHYCPRWEED